MDNRFDKMDLKLDKIADSLSDINVTIAKQEENLKEHMRRTELNEIAIGKLADALAPIKSHVDHMKGAGKLLLITGTVVSLLGGIAKLLGLI